MVAVAVTEDAFSCCVREHFQRMGRKRGVIIVFPGHDLVVDIRIFSKLFDVPTYPFTLYFIRVTFGVVLSCWIIKNAN
jgi:hypothetical protein